MIRSTCITLLLLIMIVPGVKKHEQLLPVSQVTVNQPPDYREIARFGRNELYISDNFDESFAFSPDGSMIAAAATASTVTIQEINTGKILLSLEYPEPLSVSWSPDGSIVSVGGYQKPIRFWNALNGEFLYEIGNVSFGYVAWSPDSTRFVTSDRQLYDARSGEAIPASSLNHDASRRIYWSPDGTMFLTTAGWEDHYLNLWSASGESLDTYWGYDSAGWNPASTQIATSGQIRDVWTGLPVLVIPEMEYEIAWHPGGQWIASIGNDGGVSLWDAATGALVTTWLYDDCGIDRFVWSADGERFAASCKHNYPDYRNDLIIRERVDLEQEGQ